MSSVLIWLLCSERKIDVESYRKGMVPDGCIISSGEREDPKKMKPSFPNNETVTF